MESGIVRAGERYGLRVSDRVWSTGSGRFHGSLGLEGFANIAEPYNEPGGHALGAGLIDIYKAAGFMAEDALSRFAQ